MVWRGLSQFLEAFWFGITVQDVPLGVLKDRGPSVMDADTTTFPGVFTTKVPVVIDVMRDGWGVGRLHPGLWGFAGSG